MPVKLSAIIKEQTKILFYNIQETMNSVTDTQFNEIICEWPLWKHFYHMLHSLDQWFINPFDYNEPEFHEDGMNSLYEASEKNLSRTELIHYYKGIKTKLEKYIDHLTDESLSEFPEKCKFDRLTLILAQYRHLMYHIGFIHSCIFQKTGVWPEYIGISPPIKGIRKSIQK